MGHWKRFRVLYKVGVSFHSYMSFISGDVLDMTLTGEIKLNVVDIGVGRGSKVLYGMF